ncbi:MAG: shikimate kinase [Lachnospiraceae bacterium]|nr:shikimate kinase [Lachnospiraceae bacterium]
MKNVVLVGFMGCGKTTVGMRLSYRLKKAVEDTDKRIEREQGMAVSEIFRQYGEGHFRDLETELLQRMCRENVTRIIATGGGLPIREENRELLHRLGHVIYLRIRPETVYERLKDDHTRPLLQGENPQAKIQRLMEERREIYQAAADSVIDVDELTTEEILQKIEDAIKEEE